MTPITSNILDPVSVELPPSVWDHPASPEPTLKPVHAHWITTHIYEILERGGYTKPHEWLKLYMTGSLCTYQYSDSSDVDVSLFVDAVSLPEWSRAEMIGLMIKGVEGLTLPGTPYELQAYVVSRNLTPSDLYRPGLRAGYDIATHHWVSPPDRGLAHDAKAQENGSYVYALEVADKMHKLLEYEPSKAVLLWHQIHRKRAVDEKMGKGDFAESNLAYKMLFKRGLVPQIAEVSGEHIAGQVIQGPWGQDPSDDNSPYRTCPNCGESEFEHIPRYENVQGEWMGPFWHCHNCAHHEDSGIRMADWTGPGDVSLTTQPAIHPMQKPLPGQEAMPSPFANVNQWQINIAQPSLHYQHMDDFLREFMINHHPDVPFQTQRGKGAWEGTPEDSTALHLYGTPHPQMQEVVQSLGRAVPNEDYLAIMPHGHESYLWANPFAKSRAVASRRTGGLGLFGAEIPQERFGSAASLPFAPSTGVTPSPRSEQDPRVAFGPIHNF